MARSYANIYCAIWDDEEFCELSSDAQRVYFMLVTQRDITACGTLALTLKRWGSTVNRADQDRLEPALKELSEARFVVIDDQTEELLVRTFVKHDGGYKHAKRLMAVVGYAEAIRSRTIRSAMATELQQLGIRSALDSEPVANREATGSGRSVVTEGGTTPHTTDHNPEPGTGNLNREPSGGASAIPNREPPVYCSKHQPNGTEEACGPCGNAGRVNRRWHEDRDRIATEARHAAVAARLACPYCDDKGLRELSDSAVVRCDHQPESRAS